MSNTQIGMITLFVLTLFAGLVMYASDFGLFKKRVPTLVWVALGSTGITGLLIIGTVALARHGI